MERCVVCLLQRAHETQESAPTLRSERKADQSAFSVYAFSVGLGYYSRAARLFEGAKVVVQKFDGRLPDDIAVLQADVPGIGRYSAGARTFAFLI